jgi:hypothetical protein
MYMHMYKHMHMHMHMHMYIHMYMHMYANIHTYTYMLQALTPPLLSMGWYTPAPPLW